MKKIQRLSHRDYYRAVEAIKANRDTFLRDKPIYTKAAAQVAAMCSIEAISLATFREMMTAAGVEWESPYNDNGGRLSASRNEVRILATAVCKLYRQLGAKPDAEICELANESEPSNDERRKKSTATIEDVRRYVYSLPVGTELWSGDLSHQTGYLQTYPVIEELQSSGYLRQVREDAGVGNNPNMRRKIYIRSDKAAPMASY
jgi:hypothetical protein